MVPINGEEATSSNSETVKIGDYSYSNPLKDRKMVINGEEKPVTITTTTETEVLG